MHDRGDKEREKGGKKLVGTREEKEEGGERRRLQFSCSHQRLSRCRKLQRM